MLEAVIGYMKKDGLLERCHFKGRAGDAIHVSGWVLKTTKQLVPVITHLQQKLLIGLILHCDETTVQVLQEPDKSVQCKS